MGNKLATWVTRQVCRFPIRDAQSGFRAFSREAALRLNLTGKYTYVQESLIQATYKGLKIELQYFTKLLTSLNAGGFPVESGGQLRYQASNPVGDAVLLYALVQGPLWEKVRRRPEK